MSVRSSWPGESTDMQYDPFRSSRDLGLTWPEVKLWPWPFKVILYMVRRALTRQTRWYQIRCSIFKIKDFIVEKPFWKILEFWPLETPILTWAKKWPKWFRNDFSWAFERCLSFFSTATRSRDHGGGRSNAPPPPAGGGKSRGPAGRGLTPADFFLWGHLKSVVYTGNPQSIPELKAAVKRAVRGISVSTCRATMRSVLKRTEKCLERKGGHLENVI